MQTSTETAEDREYLRKNKGEEILLEEILIHGAPWHILLSARDWFQSQRERHSYHFPKNGGFVLRQQTNTADGNFRLFVKYAGKA